MAATAKVDKRGVFAAHELFSRFSPAEIERLVSFSHARSYHAGEVIFEKGSPGQGLMAVLSGRVRISSPSPEGRSEEHTSELQSLMRISYAVFCLKKKQKHMNTHTIQNMKYTT